MGRMRILKFLVKASLIFILCQVVLISLLIAASQIKAFDNLPLVGGNKPLVVLSGSMEPALKVGSVVVVGRVNPSQIKEGDVITFTTPADLSQAQPAGQTLTTHRVSRIIDNHGIRNFETKGDANNDVDANMVSETDVLGKASFSVPYLGYASHYLRGRTGLFILLAVALGIIAYEGRNIFIQLRQRRYAGLYQ